MSENQNPVPSLDKPEAPAAPAYASEAPRVAEQAAFANAPVAGAVFAEQQQVIAGEQKSKVLAGVLGIILGSLGIHNFYLGYTKKALIQLLVSVLSLGILSFFMAVWGLVEGIFILIGRPGYTTDAAGVPLRD